MSSKIHGILFDFNGTMFFDEPFQEKSWREFLESKIGRTVSDDELQEYVHGRNAEITFPYFLKREFSRAEIAALEEEKEVVYRNLCLANRDKFHLALGLPQFLDELVRKNIPITIATASGYNNVKFFFQHLELDKWFDFDKVVLNDGTIPGKPEPDIYLKAARAIDIDIKNCAVFEDTKSGVIAASRAGAGKVIGVASMLDDKTLLSFGATATIKNYSNTETLYNQLFT